MDEPVGRKLTDDEFKDRLVSMLKNGDIKYSDVPKRFKDTVAKEVYGRYPMRSLEDLGVIIKNKTKDTK